MATRNKTTELTSTEIQTIYSLAKNRLRLSKVSDITHYHRNSVMYHIGRIKMKTGLNPLDFYDMVKLIELIGGDLHGGN